MLNYKFRKLISVFKSKELKIIMNLLFVEFERGKTSMFHLPVLFPLFYNKKYTRIEGENCIVIGFKSRELYGHFQSMGEIRYYIVN